MGACTFAITGHDVHGRHRVVKGTLTFSDDYDTGGDSIDLAEVGLSEVRDFLVEGNDQGASVDLDVTDPKVPLALLYTGDGTEASASADNSGIAVPVWLLGS